MPQLVDREPSQPVEGHTQDHERPLQPAGIVERLVRDDSDRKKFLKAVGGAGAASFTAFVLAACGSSSKEKAEASATRTTSSSSSSAAAAEGGDLAIVNYALTLEYLETAFYKKVAASGLFSGATLSQLKQFGSQEAEHVTALTATVKQLGGKPAEEPQSKFPLESAGQVANLAYAVENLGASAYLGQAGRIQSAEVLAAALSIHSVEARHASTLGTLVKKTVTPDGAFAKPASMATVLKAVKPFIV
ncbi:MAG TPA: ferritin-like domain-containing protein [Solirubrobacteraceae bacterium]|jgi:rubrerythrin